MARPKVTVSQVAGNLSRSAGTADGIAGLLISGVALPGKIALNEPKQLFSLTDAVALGLNASYDTANSCKAYKHIADFYEEAGEGAELWIMLTDKEDTLSEVADKSNANGAIKLLNAASGKVRLLGITRVPDGAYTPATTTGIDDNTDTAVTNVQELAGEFAAGYKPFVAFIEGRSFTGVPANLKDYRTVEKPRVAIVISNNEATSGANVGRYLGRQAKNPVQRNPGRVRDGALSVKANYMSSAQPAENYATAWDAIHDKGYTFMVTHPRRAGYFWVDDLNCNLPSSDTNSISAVRTIDKATLLVYDELLSELLDNTQVDASTGRLAAGYTRALETRMRQSLENNMQSNGEIAGAIVSIDPEQNVISSEKLTARVQIIQVSTNKRIEATVEFFNPLNA